MNFAQNLEVVCDRYVLMNCGLPSYGWTLLALAEFVSSRGKREARVVDLAGEQRLWIVSLLKWAKVTITAFAISLVTVAGMGTMNFAVAQNTVAEVEQEQINEVGLKDAHATERPEANDVAVPNVMLRGEGEKLEMRVRGRVLDLDGKPAQEFWLKADVDKQYFGRDEIPVKVTASEFEVWVPIGGSHLQLLRLAAESANSNSRVFQAISSRELHQAASEGIELQLAPINRVVTVSVVHDNIPVANAHLKATLWSSEVLSATTGPKGNAEFRLQSGDRLDQVTAWTDDFRIGGYTTFRKPYRDPLGTEFKIELSNCRDQKIRLVSADDDSPLAHVAFELIVGTGAPDYNFPFIPQTLPASHMTTDEKGEATFRWFPDWNRHRAYVEMANTKWVTSTENHKFTVSDDGVMVMPLKQRVLRKPMSGSVKSDRFDIGGRFIQIHAYQGEQQGRTDDVSTFTDSNGVFTADCIPGATYTICVDDGRLVSNMIDLIPYDVTTGTSNLAELDLNEGLPVEVHVTAGPNRTPMKHQTVFVSQYYRFSWKENGEQRNGQASRSCPVFMDDAGVAHARALPGTLLEVFVEADDWRSEKRIVAVKDDGVTLVEVHREFSTARRVNGHLVAPDDLDVTLADAKIVYGAIDGQTDEREATICGTDGKFTFKTKAIQLVVFGYTTDGRAAGIAIPENADGPIELQLKPTMDLHGKLLGHNDKPLANHGVRASLRVTGERNLNTSFAKNLIAMTSETTTDSEGNYTLKNLPTESELTLEADSIGDAEHDAYLGRMYLVFGEKRPRVVSRLRTASTPAVRSLSQTYDALLRDAHLGDFYVLVLCYHEESAGFINEKLLDRETIPEVMSFLNLNIHENSVTNDIDQAFVASKNWQTPKNGIVAAYVVAANGDHLAHMEFDVNDSESASKASQFIRRSAPPQADAQAKWDTAFAEAKRSGRCVWARIGQRYCGPCFGFAGWLDDNNAVLARDYVFLKVDDVRDKHGVEVAKRIANHRDYVSLPFHAILDADGKLLIDSESRFGNIGFPAGSYDGCRHLERMLKETRLTLTDQDVQQVLRTLDQ